MLPNQPNASQAHGERHTIETPEQTRLEFPVAGIGSRFLALSVDLLIQAAVGLVLLLIAVFLGISGVFRNLPFSGQWAAALAIAFVFLLHFGYFIGFEIVWRGQTPGKRFVDIRVIKDSGRPLSVSETIGRNLMRIADQLPVLYAVGILSMLVTAHSKRLGDLVAGAIVVREGSLAELRPTWHSGLAAASVSGGGLQQLSTDDLVLVDTFLARRHELPDHVRLRVASEILARLQPQLSVPADPGSSAESILESLAYERRSARGYL